MDNTTQVAIKTYEEVVSPDDEVTMVLKTHLLLEQSLWEFISRRVRDENLLKKLRSTSGIALIQLAQAIATRDEIPIDNSKIIWPALYSINSLRNMLVHQLRPDQQKIEHCMRDIAKRVLGESTNCSKRDFYYAAWALVSYPGLAQEPLDFSDVNEIH